MNVYFCTWCVTELLGHTGHVLGRHGDVAAGQGQMNDTVDRGQGRANADTFQGDISHIVDRHHGSTSDAPAMILNIT